MQVCVFEDAGVERLGPLALTRPACDLWCGASPLLRKQCRYFGASEADLFVRPHLADWCRSLHPGRAVNDPNWPRAGPALLVNARWLPPEGTAPERLGAPHVALVGSQVAYAALPPGWPDVTPESVAERVASLTEALPRFPAGGHMVDRPWDLVRHNGEALAQDFARFRARPGARACQGEHVVIGRNDQVFVDAAARVEPLAVLDATAGPVIVDRGAVVQAFSRLEGPCYVGPDCRVLGARARGSTVGPACRVGGEVEDSIFQGNANKAHEGFVGHSWVGEWVNLAAGTQVSDLRNDYRSVRAGPSGGTDTGLLKAGALLGDYTRTGVGALLDCGTVAGAFAQLLPGGTYLPRAVPSFCTCAAGRLRVRSDFQRLFGAAAAAMRRRGQVWTDAHVEFFLALYESTAAQREEAMRQEEQRNARQPFGR